MLASVATCAHAQTTPPLPPLRATVAVTGTTRVLTLAAAPGPELLGFPLSPGVQRAVFYARPSTEYGYDLSAVRVLVSNQSIRSSTGQVLIDLVLPDSVTHGPTGRCLLPTPLVLTNREVRKARTVDARCAGLPPHHSGGGRICSGYRANNAWAPIPGRHVAAHKQKRTFCVCQGRRPSPPGHFARGQCR